MIEAKQRVTEIYRFNEEGLNKKNVRLIVNRGSTRSSKTYSILQLLIFKALNEPNTTITFVSETIPKIRKTLLVDMKDIMKSFWNIIGNYHQTNFEYRFPNKSLIQLVSADSEQKIRGMKTDYLFIDEVNAVSEEIYTQLSIRTSQKIIVSFNPTNEFYITDYVNNSKGETIEYVSTYQQNPFLTKLQIDDIQARGRRDENFRRVFELGEYGSAEGIIFRENVHWQLTEQLPEVYDEELWGQDYGFTNDPTTLIQVRFIDNDVYVKEHLYKTDLLNRQIALEIRTTNLDNKIIIADSAEPKTIADLRRTYGINIRGVKKEEILPSIENLQTRNIFVTDDSINLIKELRNYSWHEKKKDKKGRTIPIDNHNHCLDALRYVNDTYNKPKSKNNGKVIRL